MYTPKFGYFWYAEHALGFVALVVVLSFNSPKFSSSSQVAGIVPQCTNSILRRASSFSGLELPPPVFFGV